MGSGKVHYGEFGELKEQVVAVRPFESAACSLHYILQSIVCVVECFAYSDECTVVYKTCGEFILPLCNVDKICIVECVE